ncbi:ankyrin repeat domain-containing protein 50-like [Haliotis rufescens]|uniref:ankyrin repeat domain-containing protein 50-like n=1 Tax=Haliotis rufescens TaxID=6454 RepID=UPI00201F1E40|nr:ankyrin repeat domain-containing protein 50-like [Haliotis rufescens]
MVTMPNHSVLFPFCCFRHNRTLYLFDHCYEFVDTMANQIATHSLLQIQEINERDAMQVKLIQVLTEQIQKASSHPSRNPGQIEGLSHIQLTQQETALHASSDPSRVTPRLTPQPRSKKQADATPSPADCEGLHDASRDGNLEEVKRLLSLGVDVNCTGGGSWTPVMEAAGGGHRDVVELLVSKGADVSLVDEYGDNILHYACMGGHFETVKFVLSLHVVDINSRGWRSMTPVMRAADKGHRDMVEFLVSEGADVSLVDEDGDNTLHHLACYGGDLETVKLVLSLNVVDIDARNKSGQTADDVARDWGYPRVADLLVSRGAQ